VPGNSACSRAKTRRALSPAWLLSSADHVQVWLELTAFDEELARSLGYPHFGAIVAAVPEEDGRGPRPAAVECSGETGAEEGARHCSSGCLASLVAAWPTWKLLQHPGIEDAGIISTALGEHREVALEDGTRLHLNTQSSVRWHFTRGERTVALLAGEALFDIGKIPAHFTFVGAAH